MKITVFIKIFIILLLGFYMNKKTYDPIEYFSKKPYVEKRK